MNTGLLANGLMLMLVGMGTVFVFLTLLVIATTLMSRLVMTLQPRQGAADEAQEIAAIAAALILYRSASPPEPRQGS
jgi:oxaloacetate decarboxylase gamma subunit